MAFTDCFTRIEAKEHKIQKLLGSKYKINTSKVLFKNEMALDIYVTKAPKIKPRQTPRLLIDPLLKKAIESSWAEWHEILTKVYSKNSGRHIDLGSSTRQPMIMDWYRKFCPLVRKQRVGIFSIITSFNKATENLNPKCANLLRCIKDLNKHELQIIVGALGDDNHETHNEIAKILIQNYQDVPYLTQLTKLIYHPSSPCRNKALEYLKLALQEGIVANNAVNPKLLNHIKHLSRVAQPLNRSSSKDVLKLMRGT